MDKNFKNKFFCASFWGHEPIYFYLRRGGAANTCFGTGEWTRVWHDRLHGEEAIAKLAGLGVNLIYPHFYKAFGLEFEQEEMLRTREIVKYGHQHGMTVLGYATISAVFPESLANEIPELENILRVQRSHWTDPWAPGSHRDNICLNAGKSYFDEYLHRVIDFGLDEVGLDGFHFDNAYARPCYCPHCAKAFREYLAAKLHDPRKLGLPTFDFIRLPGTDEINQVASYHREFLREQYNERIGGLFRYVKEKSSGKALVLTNVGFGDPRKAQADFGHEVGMMENVDLIFIETSRNFIERTPERLKHVVTGFKLGEMQGLRVLNTTWQERGKPPKSDTAIKRVLAESFAFAGISNINWIARPTRHGSEMILDHPEATRVISRYLRFAHEHQDLYCGTIPENRVKVLYPMNSRLHLGIGFERVFHLVCDALVENAIPFSIIRTGQAPQPGDTVILPLAEYLTDAEISEIESWMTPLVSVGRAGLYHFDSVEREVKPFPCAKLVEVPGDSLEEINRFKNDLPELLPVVASLNIKGPMLELRRAADGDLLIHLVNPDNEMSLDNLEICLPGRNIHSCRAFSPDGVIYVSTSMDKITVAKLDTLITLKVQCHG